MTRGQRLFEELMRFKPDGVTANGWAVTAGVSRTIWADLRRHGNPSRRTLEKLLGAAGMTLAEFEALRIGQVAPNEATGAALADPNRGWRDAAMPEIPLFASQVAGEWGEPGSRIELYSTDRASLAGAVDRPRVLAADASAYAVTMAGVAMWPRFRAGRHLLVAPSASVAVGDDVVVMLTGDRSMISELVRLSDGKIELRQFNPDVTFEVEAADVVSVHKIIGEAI
ncbi:hypothetical protein LZ518_06370 [Sphingomonas sp. RB56-2]|uniref:Peptidase S24/S26A/S26B/S26C domain-containing protein n=1 Tax=Sphingomonas brevis TaxID=2908206 RepID=A0ABT0S8L6_9SPHN|nr:S24 family peptidase [Sphingomonas brevis]MCL6740756.1 hypothetical protein [Sphingomonas brevis]